MVLAYIGDEDGLIVGGFAHLANHFAHQQRSLGGMQCLVDDLVILLLFVGLEACNPRTVLCLIDIRNEVGKGLLAVAENGHIYLHVLVDFRGVDLEVNDLGLLGVCLEVAGHTIVETHTHSNQQVALIGHHIGTQVAVHTQHTLVEWMVGRDGRKAKHRTSERNLRLLGKFEHFLIGTCQFDTLTHQHEWFHAPVDQFGSLLDYRHFANRLGHIRTNEVDLLRFIVDDGGLCILREVEHDGTGTTRTCNIECTSHGPCHIFGTTDLIVPLADRLCHAHYIDLLEGIGTQHGGSYLSADDDKRCGVDHCIGKTGDGVHGTGA